MIIHFSRDYMIIINIILDKTLPITHLEEAIPVPTGSPRILRNPIITGIVIAYNHHGVISRSIAGTGVNTIIETTTHK